MSFPKVSIEYKNGNLGRVAYQDDRVMGLIHNGPGDASSPAFVCYSLDEFISQYAATGRDVNHTLSLLLRNQVSDFYQVAGSGAELWVMVDSANGTFTAEKGQAMMNASDGRINVLALFVLSLVDANILGLADNFAVASAARQQPVRIILDGANYTGDAVAALNLKSLSFNHVAVCLSGIRVEGHAALGLLLGRIASIPVNQNIGRVKSGVAATAAYLTNGTTISSSTPNLELLNDKGYIFLRKLPTKAGFYWNDDHMATSDSDDYYSLSNGRTIDKVARIAFATFLDELLDTITVDQLTGKIVATTMKYYQTKIEDAVRLQMKAEGEISDVQAFVDPNQNVLATSRLKVDLRITPTGTNRQITVSLGLYNPTKS